MSDKYRWQVDVDFEADENVLQSYETRWRTPAFLWVLAGAVVLLGFLYGVWQVGQYRLAVAEAPLKEEVQAVLALELEAFQKGDGQLFLIHQANNPAWISAQLLPENQAATGAGLTVISAEEYEDFIWADVTWKANGGMLHRTAFFRDQNGRLLHVPSAPNYWNTQRQDDHPWGRLVYYQVDSRWADDVAAFISDTVTQACEVSCLDDRLPLTVTLAQDYTQTIAPQHLRLPSPRLLALDENNGPAPIFWEKLRQQIEDYLTPATVRFAVPPISTHSSLLVMDYGRAAEAFMAIHPEISIEIVTLDSLPEELSTLAIDYDGAAVPPSKAMLTAGLVRDLTDYIRTDPDFDQVDFYEQIWQGAIWQERTWWLPQAAAMPLIFYDKAAYRRADRAEPSLRWTWAEMTRDVSNLAAAQPAQSSVAWGFIDPGLDTVFSYAYNWNNQCTEKATVLCQSQLHPQNVAAALEWYGQMAGGSAQMPNLTKLTSLERNNILLSWQGAKRRAAIWVDVPLNYEFRLLLNPLGVVPFPGSDKFDGITPLWVQGSFISQRSERPFAVWQWLKFLSYQQPVPRLIPARPSVAAEMNFWGGLPPQLDDAMRVAFPFARPVTLEDQSLLSWSQIEAVLSDELSPTDAVFQQPGSAWFGRD